MPTRILPVRDAEGDPYPVALGHSADGSPMTTTATVTASALLAYVAGAASTTTATITAAASSSRGIAATATTTATVTAAASVTSPTDLSASLTEGATGSYAPGALIVPGYDQAYAVTVADARFPSFPTITTPGVQVTLPLPSTPDVSHWVTVTYTIANRDRRIFHNRGTRWVINGDVIEPSPTNGDTTTLTYTWDVAEQGWYVSAYSAAASVRTHGPNESSGTIPLYFTPECRALAGFSTIKAAQLNALTALPADTAAALVARGTVVDVMSDQSGNFFELMAARDIFDPSWQSGAFGVYLDPFTNAYPWIKANGTLDGRTMLHELGHAWDRWGLEAAGHTWGVDPKLPGSPNAYDTVNQYYEGGEVASEYVYTPTTVDYVIYWPPGEVLLGGTFDRPQRANFSDEQPVVDIYAAVADKPGSYYRSTITEWTAQCFMLAWADHVPGYDSSARASLITEVGGSAIFGDFVDYAVSVGVLPSSW